jgi:hypothetical protein
MNVMTDDEVREFLKKNSWLWESRWLRTVSCSITRRARIAF